MAEGELQQTAAGCYFRTDPAYSIIPGRKQTTHLPLPLPVPYIFTPPQRQEEKKARVVEIRQEGKRERDRKESIISLYNLSIYKLLF